MIRVRNFNSFSQRLSYSDNGVICTSETAVAFNEILTLSLVQSIMEACNIVQSFQSVDEILWCDRSTQEISLAVLLHGTIFLIFYKIKFGFFLEI